MPGYLATVVDRSRCFAQEIGLMDHRPEGTGPKREGKYGERVRMQHRLDVAAPGIDRRVDGPLPIELPPDRQRPDRATGFIEFDDVVASHLARRPGARHEEMPRIRLGPHADMSEPVADALVGQNVVGLDQIGNPPLVVIR